jgi:hypothetical protein
MEIYAMYPHFKAKPINLRGASEAGSTVYISNIIDPLFGKSSM